MTQSARIRQFIVSNFYIDDANTLSDDDSLLMGGIVDSTGVVEIVSYLETEFSIQILDEEMLPDNLDCIAKITRFVARKQA
jgi:acyl carrier protein